MYIYEIGAITKYYRDSTPEKAFVWRDEIDYWAGQRRGVNTFNACKAYNPNTLHLNNLGRIGVDQNEYFINKCDIAICNMEDIEASPGSIYELVRFKMQGKPVIAFGAPNWSPHLMSCISCVVPTLQDALDLLDTMFF